MSETKTKNMSESTARKPKKVFPAEVEWRDFQFFTCEGEVKITAVEVLTEHGFLLPNGQPDNENIIAEAKILARNLARRVLKNKKTREYWGLEIIISTLKKLDAEKNKHALYFFIVFLYGSVLWRMPYNLQRLPIVPKAFNLYLLKFTEVLLAELSKGTKTEEKETAKSEEPEKPDKPIKKKKQPKVEIPDEIEEEEEEEEEEDEEDNEGDESE